jgi:hypothetical protein
MEVRKIIIHHAYSTGNPNKTIYFHTERVRKDSPEFKNERSRWRLNKVELKSRQSRACPAAELIRTDLKINPCLFFGILLLM